MANYTMATLPLRTSCMTPNALLDGGPPFHMRQGLRQKENSASPCRRYPGPHVVMCYASFVTPLWLCNMGAAAAAAWTRNPKEQEGGRQIFSTA